MNKNIPCLKKQGTTTQLIVDDKPFLILGGELHNSSSSSKSYMAEIWPKLGRMNLNTVLVNINWEQLEPEENVFDFSLVEDVLNNAKKQNLRVIILWFGTWKNGQSSYVPMWVKRDSKRFFRVKTKEGKTIETISPFCEAIQKADAKAFSMLLQYLKNNDKEHTVIMVQPENEVGIFQDFDYNKEALETLNEQVPKALMLYLIEQKEHLQKKMYAVWQKQSFPTTGNWKEVFGDTPYAKEFLMVWQYATFINDVAKSGKKHLSLPMFVNAWLVQKAEDLPGVYPNGGPVAHVMDIYKAAAPDIDMLCPDIYLPNFKDICVNFHREDNPLFIPESRNNIGRAFYAIAEHDAMGFSPFGIEDFSEDKAFIEAYSVLKELTPLILKYQGHTCMYGILRQGNELGRKVQMGDYHLEIIFEQNEQSAYGLIIQTKADEFIVAGINFRVVFSARNIEQIGYIGQIQEGRFKNNVWITWRWINGDESFSHEALRVLGRNTTPTLHIAEDEDIPPQPIPGQVDSNKEIAFLETPNIYKITTYIRD